MRTFHRLEGTLQGYSSHHPLGNHCLRSHYLLPPKRIQAYHQQVVSQVRAEQQAQHLEVLQPHLTPDEKMVLRRGRNATPSRRQRASAAIYQQATSLETLVGYLYLTNSQRLAELFSYLNLDPAD